MLDASTSLLAYAIVATLSPIGFAATVAVIESGRLKALAFGLGFLFAQLATCALLVFFDASLIPNRQRDHPALRGVLELAFGIGLLWLATRLRRRPFGASGSPRASERSRALLERLRNLRPVTALAAGVVLGVGGPKRLVLTGLAASTIGAAGVTDPEAAVLVAGYTVVATLLVWVPILAFEIAGKGIVARLEATQNWFGRHQRPLTFYPLVLLGLFAVADSIRSVTRAG